MVAPLVEVGGRPQQVERPTLPYIILLNKITKESCVLNLIEQEPCNVCTIVIL